MQSIRQQLTSSALLQELPWNCSVILEANELGRSCKNSPWLSKLVEAVEYYEEHTLLASNIKKLFRIAEPLAFVLQSSSEDTPVATNPKDTFELVTVLVNYRLIDIALWLEGSGDSDRNALQYRRGRFPAYLSRLSLNLNWRDIIRNGLNSLECVREAETSTDLSALVGDIAEPIIGLFTSADRRSRSIAFHKIIRNFEITAFHLGYILKGYPDLPATFADLRVILSTMGPGIAFEDISNDMQNLRHLRLPLQLATSISPVFLFLDLSLQHREFDRGFLLKAWASLGGDKPLRLESIERRIWNFLFETASGSRRFNDGFKTLLADLRAIDLDHITPQEALWFSHEYPVVPNPNTGAANSNSPHSATTPAPGPDSITQTGSNARSVAVHNTEDVPTLSLPSADVHGPRRSSREQNSKKPIQPTPNRSTNTKKSKARKRKHSSSAQVPSSGAPASSVAYIIDLTQDLASDDEPDDRNLEEINNIKEKVKGERVKLHGPFGPMEYTPEFHFQNDLAFFSDIVTASGKYCDSAGVPFFSSEPTKSAVCMLSEQEFNSKTTEEVQRIFSRQHILVYGNQTPKCNFDNMSIPVDSDLNVRGRLGTMKDLLDGSKIGRALNALDLPMQTGAEVPSSLSSDLWAWTHTYNRRLCKTTNRFPTAEMKWALVSTQGSYSAWHLDCDGLCTMIEVQTGAKLWVVARPKPGEDIRSFLTRIDSFLQNLDVTSLNDDRWDCEAVLLTPGTKFYMRPNTFHCVFTLEPTIVHGGHFYATSTIRESCIASYHSFVLEKVISNTSHQGASLELLRRLVTYFESVYTKDTYPNCSKRHCIPIDTFDGVIDFLTFLNFLEIFELIYCPSYTATDITIREHWDFVHARRAGRIILHWLHQRFSLTGADGAPLLNICYQQRHFLDRQLNALVNYKRRAEDSGIESRTIGCTAGALLEKVKLISPSKLHDPFETHEEDKANLALQWPSHLIFGLNPRSHPLPRMLEDPTNGNTTSSHIFMAYICGDKESIQNAEGIARGMMEAWNKNNPPETNGLVRAASPQRKRRRQG